MVPAGEPTNDTVDLLAEMLTEGDLVVDGGNSNYNDSLEHADLLAEQGVGFVDAGISGGVWGREDGYAIMVGGDDEDVDHLAPVLEALAPDGEFFHVGEVGAGHFTKMVHNGVEYALMQAYAEGFELLSASDLDIDVPTAFASWQRGSVVRSWLLDLLVDALDDDPELSRRRGLRRGLGRGAVDGPGGDRARRAGPGDRRRAVRPVRLAPGRLGRDEGRRDAPRNSSAATR
jgi:6-phosphogluconate dehydrogenase